MKRLLAVNVYGNHISCCIGFDCDFADGKTDSIVYIEDSSRYHSTILLPLIQQTLQQAQLTLQDIDFFCFSSGPGRFSAQRLVCSTVRSLAYTQQKPLISVPTFFALAEANFPNVLSTVTSKIKCAITAYTDHVYWGVVCRNQDNQWAFVGQPKMVSIDTTPPPNKTVKYACGDAFEQHPALAGTSSSSTDIFNKPCNARHIAVIAVGMIEQQQFTEPTEAVPLYVRHKIALTIAERQQIQQNKAG